ncbi:hypothetical protein H6P81_000066 [Aristolochia fimbriata]|uniref:F-box domain-containing protein n=1 Tax=Aristolochia fimbriata TaxID=158543 RepID=A0AAV7F3B2_ARIFI|nr:hypothetical protein H6P81_000066 [Aristolochia fimbriata]
MELEDQPSMGTCETSGDVKTKGFGEDLLMEIFRRLPAKSLFRFKCVSKDWLRLISADATLQRRKLSSMTGVFYHLNALDCVGHSQLKFYKYARVSEDDDHFSTDHGTDISLAFLPCYPNFRIIDSCGGLLLCLSGKTKQVGLYVCNPLTRRWTALPKPPNKCSLQNAKLVLDCSESPNLFRVVMAAGYKHLRRSSAKLHIYSSDAGKWVEWEVVTAPLQYSLNNIQDAVVSEGALYAMAFPSYLARIDIKERSFAVIDLPEEKYHDAGILGTSGNRVYLMWLPRHSLRQIWVLKDWRANEWILKYEMGEFGTTALDRGGSPLCRLPSYDYRFQFQYHPVLHSELELLILRTHCKLFAYHLYSGKVEEIGSIRCDPDVSGHYFRGSSNRFSVFPYSPCLDPLE